MSFFPSKENSKMVKNCLQAKGVLYESSQLQVGYVHFQKGRHLDFTIFLTAQIELDSIRLRVEGGENLVVHL